MSFSSCLYIAGYGRSGSTLLDTILSNCVGFHGIGEASNLFDAVKANEKCSCGSYILECPYWSNRLAGVDVALLQKEQRRAEGVLGWVFFPGSKVYASFWKFFFNVSAATHSTIVDSSKISRATVFRPLNFRRIGVNVKIIHLYRDPDDLLLSLLKGSNKYLAAGGRPRLNHFFLLRSFIGAFFANFLTVIVGRFLLRNYLFVHYAQLVSDPEAVLRRLNATLMPGRSFSDLSVGHAVSGNRMRRAGQSISVRNAVSAQAHHAAPVFYKYLFRVLKVFEHEASHS